MDAKGRAVAATLLSSLFWGSSFPVIEYGVRSADPRLFLFLRFLFAMPMAFAVMALLKFRLGRVLGSFHVWLLGSLNAVAFMTQYMAQAWTTATNTALLVNLYLVFVGLGSVMFLKEKFTWKLGVAGCIGFFGVFLIETNAGSIGFSSHSLIGDLLALFSGTVWGAYIIISKILLSRKKKKEQLSPEELTCGVCITTFIPLLFLLPFLRFDTVMGQPKIVLLAVYLAVFSTVLAYLLWYKGLKELSAIMTSVLLMMEIAFAAIISYLWLGERFTLWTGIGGIFICAAAALSAMND
jgi:drug/metabolite transporter (DMT)-like permease